MSATLSTSTLLTIALAPLVGAALAGIWGTQLGGNWLGRRFTHSFTILGVLVSFVLSASVLWDVTQHSARYNQTLYEWMVVAGLKMEVGFLVDGLTAMMMCVVTFVSLMVHVYTIGYMEEDDGYNRFFSYISLFTFSMLMLVMSNNMLQLFFGWEAVGLVSYLLIGFWFKRPTATFANMKAFLVNRVGDFGFILGIGLIAAYAGTLNYTEVFAKSGDLTKLTLPGTDWALITVACICLFIGAMGKSAQFPLHVWLPDSMEGPTPISALIHAATMVTAGIFMVARMSPLFELSDAALNVIMVIGSITALFMGFMGIIQNDIKRVVAYSTLSQLGYMTVALGASAYPVAVFHLMTHAFFKALLFLGAGAVIVAMHHNQDIRYMGGLARHRNTQVAWITSLLGSLALIGTPLFAGFYSKDMIIEAVRHSNQAFSAWAYLAVLAGVFVTAFYSFRMYFLVFHGRERWNEVPHDDHHHEDGHGDAHLPINPGWSMNMPLVLLAVPSVLIGFLFIQPMLFGDFFKDAIFVDGTKHPAMAEIGKIFHGSLQLAGHAIYTWPFWLDVLGVGAAWFLYMKAPHIPAKIAAKCQPLVKLLENKYYLDAFNERVLAAGARALGTGFWQIGDQRIIDGAVVNGSWKLVNMFSRVVRLFQSGYLYHYALSMIVGLLGLLSYFVWLKK